MRKLFVIGMGAGNPEHLTLEAVGVMGMLDVVFVPRKAGKEDLAELREAMLATHGRPDLRIVPFDLPVRDTTLPYAQGVDDWHRGIAAIHVDLLSGALGEDEAGGFLVWGDPSLYDSTLRILEIARGLGAPDFALRVVPGITSIQALTAAHGTVLNRIGEEVTISTGRRVAAQAPQTDTVVMLDGVEAFAGLEGDAYDIAWGAFLGMDEEVLVAGRLAEVSDEIVETRRAARARHGWIMDTYLLRKRDGAP